MGQRLITGSHTRSPPMYTSRHYWLTLVCLQFTTCPPNAGITRTTLVTDNSEKHISAADWRLVMCDDCDVTRGPLASVRPSPPGITRLTNLLSNWIPNHVVHFTPIFLSWALTDWKVSHDVQLYFHPSRGCRFCRVGKTGEVCRQGFGNTELMASYFLDVAEVVKSVFSSDRLAGIHLLTVSGGGGLLSTMASKRLD